MQRLFNSAKFTVAVVYVGGIACIAGSQICKINITISSIFWIVLMILMVGVG